MSLYKVVDELERAMRTTVNTSYTELVKEINYNMNKLLQTALSNAETFDESIKAAIMDLREHIHSNLSNKDLNHRKPDPPTWSNGQAVINKLLDRDIPNDHDTRNPMSRPETNSWDTIQNGRERNTFEYNDSGPNTGNSGYPHTDIRIKEEDDTTKDNNMDAPPYAPPSNRMNNNYIPPRTNVNFKNPKSAYNLTKEQMGDRVGEDLILVHEETLKNGLTIKSFTCKECAKKYTTKFDLKRHIARTH